MTNEPTNTDPQPTTIPGFPGMLVDFLRPDGDGDERGVILSVAEHGCFVRTIEKRRDTDPDVWGVLWDDVQARLGPPRG